MTKQKKESREHVQWTAEALAQSFPTHVDDDLLSNEENDVMWVVWNLEGSHTYISRVSVSNRNNLLEG